jgi:hypothetical protein
MSEKYIQELREAYNDNSIDTFTAEEWFRRLDNGDHCHEEICRLIWQRDNARLEGEREGVVKGLDMAMAVFDGYRPNVEFEVGTLFMKFHQLKSDYQEVESGKTK